MQPDTRKFPLCVKKRPDVAPAVWSGMLLADTALLMISRIEEVQHFPVAFLIERIEIIDAALLQMENMGAGTGNQLRVMGDDKHRF